jgi:hypothetical protein
LSSLDDSLQGHNPRFQGFARAVFEFKSAAVSKEVYESYLEEIRHSTGVSFPRPICFQNRKPTLVV